MGMPDDFCVFILTHKRAKKVYTYKTLMDLEYSGKLYLVVDDKDPQIDEYRSIYGDKILLFSKEEIRKSFDTADNFGKMNCVIYARNVCFDLAKQMGIKWFLQLDDDYKRFSYKYGDNKTFHDRKLKTIDNHILYLLEFYKKTNFTSIAFAQTGDYLGGHNGLFAMSLTRRRKAMNSFFCSTEREFRFIGNINEDVNTYTRTQQHGNTFMTVPQISLLQHESQSNTGGMTDFYLDSGTYIKSFYTVMFCPSSVKVAMMNSKNPRLHHKINWMNTIPMIVKEEWKSGRFENGGT